jgi:hypothetical protein
LISGIALIPTIDIAAHAAITVLITNTIAEMSLKIANEGSGPDVSQIQKILTTMAEETERQGKNAERVINTLAEDVTNNPKSGASLCIFQLAVRQQELDNSVNSIILEIVTKAGQGTYFPAIVVDVVFESIADVQGLNFVSEQVQIKTGSDTDKEKVKETIEEVAIASENKGGSAQKVIDDVKKKLEDPEANVAGTVESIAKEKEVGNERRASEAIDVMATDITKGEDIDNAAEKAKENLGGTLQDDTPQADDEGGELPSSGQTDISDEEDASADEDAGLFDGGGEEGGGEEGGGEEGGGEEGQ